MAYYSICPKCQAHLNPNKICDCEKEDNSKQAISSKLVGINSKTGQLFFNMIIKQKLVEKESNNECKCNNNK